MDELSTAIKDISAGIESATAKIEDVSTRISDTESELSTAIALRKKEIDEFVKKKEVTLGDDSGTRRCDNFDQEEPFVRSVPRR